MLAIRVWAIFCIIIVVAIAFILWVWNTKPAPAQSTERATITIRGHVVDCPYLRGLSAAKLKFFVWYYEITEDEQRRIRRFCRGK